MGLPKRRPQGRKDTLRDITATELWHLNNEKEKPRDYRERQLNREHELPKGRYPSSRLIPPKLLHCALFGVAADRRVREKCVRRIFPLSSGGHVVYSGPELRQDDLSMFLALVALCGGKHADAYLDCTPQDLVRECGWSESTYSLTHAQQSIDRLTDAKLRGFDKAGKPLWVTDLVHEAEFGPDDKWTVMLSAKLIKLFSRPPTALNQRVRNRLTEGLETWLYGFIQANDCTRGWYTSALRQFCGSRTSDKEFGRSLRAALNKVKAAGGLESWEATRGYVTVTK